MTKVTLITIEKLLEMMENKEDFKLVETLAPEDYAAGHIPSAVSIPTPNYMTKDQMASAAEKLDFSKSDTIVVYCASYTCKASTRAARLLLEAGFENTLDFKASKRGWTDAGFKLER